MVDVGNNAEVSNPFSWKFICHVCNLSLAKTRPTGKYSRGVGPTVSDAEKLECARCAGHVARDQVDSITHLANMQEVRGDKISERHDT